jgi:hypothetical protein
MRPGDGKVAGKKKVGVVWRPSGKEDPTHPADRPLVRVGLVVIGVGGVVLGIRHLATEPALPSKVMGGPEVKEFSLREQRVGIRPYLGVPLPQLDYDLNVPTRVNPYRLTAAIEGADGKSIPVTLVFAGLNRAAYQRIGYREAVRDPRLVLREKGVKRFECPVQAIPEPVRVIPLVVPIERDAWLRRMTQDEVDIVRATASKVATFESQLNLLPREVFALERFRSSEDGPLLLTRTDWRLGPQSQGFGQFGGGYFWLSDPERPSVVELSIVHSNYHVDGKGFDLIIELIKCPDGPGFRIGKPIHHRFTDGSTVDVPAQVYRPRGTRHPGEPTSIAIEMKATPPRLSILPLAPETNTPGYGFLGMTDPRRPLSENRGPRYAKYETASSLESATLSRSPLEELGLDEVRLGEMTYRHPAGRPRTVRYGTHRLRLTLERRFNVHSVERRFVRVDDRRMPSPAGHAADLRALNRAAALAAHPYVIQSVTHARAWFIDRFREGEAKDFPPVPHEIPLTPEPTAAKRAESNAVR